MYEDIKLTPIPIKFKSKSDFWEVFLGILQVILPKKRRLTPIEIKVMVHVLTKDPFKSHFKGTYRLAMQKALDDIGSVRLSQIKGKLVKKGWIKDELPIRNLRDIQKVLESKMVDGRIKLRMQYIFNLDEHTGKDS